jgi:hypothetical protein
MHFSKLIFQFLYSILLVSNPKVYLQEDGCVCRNGIVCCTCISIVCCTCVSIVCCTCDSVNRLVGGMVFILMLVQHTLPYLYIPPSS